MTTILLIDLSSIAHPLWHTTQGSSNPNECSIQTVAKVRALASGQPHVAVCCDSGRSFRRDVSPDYKANRPESDATLQHQITLARETLVADGFPVWAVKGFEADDLLATATKAALEWQIVETADVPLGMRNVPFNERAVIIASSDKDMFQLVSDRVSVHRVAATQKATTVTPEVVRAEYGIDPIQMTEWLMLVGDKSDNILGAPGIGEVTATKLLATFGNLADTYAALDAKKAPFTEKTAKGLADLRPRLDTVRQLVTLRTDVPLPFEEVFRERVPADVAVFGGSDGAENMDGSGEIVDRPVVGGTEGTVANHGGAVSAHDGDGRGDGPRDAGRSADSTGVRASGSQEQSTANDSGLHQQQHVPAAAASGLIVRDVEVLPPPSTEFGLQLEPRSLREAALLAQEMFKSRLFSAYGTYQGVLSTILAGRELGMQAMASLRAFHIIDGKPTMSADLIRALVLKSGHAEYFRCLERTATQATFLTKRKGDPEVKLTFTVAEGRAAWPKDDAGFQKSGWGRNPADMCVARASAKLARLVYADVVFNMYAPEEFD